MAKNEQKLEFKSYSDVPFARSNSVIISQLIDEIDSLIAGGCARELIYERLLENPYNLKITFKSFVTLLSRARNKKNKKRPSSKGAGQHETTAPQNKPQPLPNGSTALKGLGNSWDAKPNENVMGDPVDD
ncbi:hypothetical protein KCQ_05491 [Pectobacterium atrosepticum ICMP 1526]|uniref:hypothetical protein n=1 Tax=Pectobacterium atrosepticum TaxID=29471 RepID=UPI00065D3FA5|nr:hypothetical protein [Pectobacterium atrosepticum]KMK87237.1 hypothetical protein KCQ_05491 [Pectobacterium atrosepticum ICMP 1526]